MNNSYVDNHLKEYDLLLPQSNNGCVGDKSFYIFKSDYESWLLNTSRDSLTLEDANNTFYLVFKLRDNIAHSLDHAATRHMFGAKYVNVYNPLSDFIQPLIRHNPTSTTRATNTWLMGNVVFWYSQS